MKAPSKVWILLKAVTCPDGEVIQWPRRVAILAYGIGRTAKIGPEAGALKSQQGPLKETTTLAHQTQLTCLLGAGSCEQQTDLFLGSLGLGP